MRKRRPSWSGIRAYFGGVQETVAPAPAQRLRVSGRPLRIALTDAPFLIEMGRQQLVVYPDRPLDTRHTAPPYPCRVFDPARYEAGISAFLSLAPGTKRIFDYRAEDQKHLFSHPREALRRHLQISHDGDALIFKDRISELGTYVSLLDGPTAVNRVVAHRQQALQTMCDLFGGAPMPLSAAEALETVRKVNRLLAREPYRRKDSYGNAGGIVDLPAHLTPILVGDLHGQVDNLLKILSENAFMQSLVRGTAALIFLGDAVHQEEEGTLEDMDSSILTMDLIFKLKLRFPEQVFFLLGNHDSFALDVMKNGVPQGLLWDKHVKAVRGESYREELVLFYQQAPLIVRANDFAGCHAGPPRKRISRETLIDVRRFPDLVHSLTWNRVKSPGYPAGYTRGDVRRFRKALDLPEDALVIVGHYPLSDDRTIWRNVRNIDHHHIVFSARPDQIGIFTRLDGEMVPQVYSTEPLLDWVKRRMDEQADEA